MLAVYHGGLNELPWVTLVLAGIASIVLAGVICGIAVIVRGIWRYFRERTNR